MQQTRYTIGDMQKFTAWLKRTINKIPHQRLYRWWRRVPKAVRAPLVAIIGSTVVITGVAMLALPGPGWAAIFLGIAILASEFAIFEKVRDWLIGELKRWYHYAQKRMRDKRNKPQA